MTFWTQQHIKKSSVGRKGPFGILFFLWMALITTLSLLPPDNLQVKPPPIPHIDKWVHFTFYAVGMTLGALFLRERLEYQLPKGTALFYMAAALALYGMIIEVLQYISASGRSAEWWDMGANILGIGFGVALSLVIFKKIRVFNWGD